ncbi:MAG TPA: aspartate aminotransferase family protein [Terriglobales bacterium]|nr:aspartate aminotransferase family protein [Terriglobales bacterium]
MASTTTTRNRSRSQQWFERAQRSLVEGVNSPSRGSAVFSGGPVMIERGRGSHVWDADGNEYVDFMMSFGALIHGHAHPTLVSVGSQAMAEGSHFASVTSAEVEAAERFRGMVPSAEVVRFCNTGSEATMLALRLARAHTGRMKFLKFEGHYHGWYDPYLLNAHSHPSEQLGSPDNPARIPDSEGIPPATFDDVVLAPWNDVDVLERVMKRHGSGLAAVISEPIMANMGCIPPRDGYLRRLRELTQEYGALLILDEVVTGFRYAPGGCQQYYGIKPDISTFGKALGAGFPVGAVAGPRSILDRMRWGSDMVLHYGTFNGHRLTMKVVAANLDLLTAENNAAYRKLHALGDSAITGLQEVFAKRKVKAIVQGYGPMFQVYFTEREAIHDYRDYCAYADTDRYSRFVHGLLDRGIYMTPSNGLHWVISTAHTQRDISTLIEAAEQACAALS